jgi:hypothetical protein
MKISIIWDIMLFSPLKINRRSGERNLSLGFKSKPKIKKKAWSRQLSLLPDSSSFHAWLNLQLWWWRRNSKHRLPFRGLYVIISRKQIHCYIWICLRGLMFSLSFQCVLWILLSYILSVSSISVIIIIIITIIIIIIITYIFFIIPSNCIRESLLHTFMALFMNTMQLETFNVVNIQNIRISKRNSYNLLSFP